MPSDNSKSESNQKHPKLLVLGMKSSKVFLQIQVFIATVLLLHISAADGIRRNQFPSDFVFGASTSAYQVEGAADEDGRKPSIWDTFSDYGKEYGGNGDMTCDQYHKYKEDIQLMANMGLEAYRFSISWSRLIPDGTRTVNPKGLQYYNNLINELISHGIQPHVTLHHWDLPQALEDEYGGWVGRKIVKDFTTYVEVCFKEYGDRVKYWTTINEANMYATGGYDNGFLPPQRGTPSFKVNCSKGNSSSEPYIAAHHMLLAHGYATSLYRKKYQNRQHGFIGFNLLAFGYIPLTNAIEDIIAAQRAQDFNIGWFMNPFMFGDYPDIMKKNVGLRLPSFTKTESNLVKGSIDFLGINFYSIIYCKNNPNSLQIEQRDFMQDMAVEYINNYTTFEVEFPITPWGLQVVLESLKQDYGNFPIYIHENGQKTQRNSSLEDWSRVNFLQAYIQALLDPLRNGSNIRGYFVWSFLDVLELLGGYKFSFGLYYINENDPNLSRQPKLSAKWYSQFLHNNESIYIEPEAEVAIRST